MLWLSFGDLVLMILYLNYLRFNVLLFIKYISLCKYSIYYLLWYVVFIIKSKDKV